MTKTQNLPHRTNHDGATNLSKSLILKNQTTQITSGFGPVILQVFNEVPFFIKFPKGWV